MRVRAAFHLHSEWSYDGSWSLEKLANHFEKKGVRVLMMTEHDRGFTSERLEEYRLACSNASNSNILVVPGIEYSDPSNTIHVLTWGDIPFFGEDQDTTAMLKHVSQNNGIAIFAHPTRKRAWKRYQNEWTPMLRAIELWNRKSDGFRPSPHAKRLQQKTGLMGTYGLDFHRINQEFPMGVSLDLDSNTVDEQAVLNSIKAGTFNPYAIGLQAKSIEKPLVYTLLNTAESLRRVIAKLLRFAKHRKHSFRKVSP